MQITQQVQQFFTAYNATELRTTIIADELGITPEKLAKDLKPYAIKPKRLLFDGTDGKRERLRGYTLAQFVASTGQAMPEPIAEPSLPPGDTQAARQLETKADNLPATLNQLIAEINANEKLIAFHKESMVKLAIQSGLGLMQAKGMLPHGEFTAWLEAHCTVGARQAQKYMKLGQEYGKSESANSFLDIDSEIKLLMFADNEPATDQPSDREFIRDSAADLGREERDNFLKQAEKLKQEAEAKGRESQGWRSDAIKYREELRLKAEEAEALKRKLAEQPKAVYITDDQKALEQAVEAHKQRAEDERQRRLKLEKSYQTDLKDGVARKLGAHQAEIEANEQRIRELEFKADRVAKEYEGLVGKKERATELAAACETIKRLFHEANIALVEIFQGDGGWKVEQVMPALQWMDRHVEAYQQAKAIVEALQHGDLSAGLVASFGGDGGTVV